MRILSPDDWAALEHLACVYAEAEALREIIRTKGHTYTTTTSKGAMVRPRPEVAQLRALAPELVSLYARFGLSPADRANVSAVPVPGSDPDSF